MSADDHLFALNPSLNDEFDVGINVAVEDQNTFTAIRLCGKLGGTHVHLKHLRELITSLSPIRLGDIAHLDLIHLKDVLTIDFNEGDYFLAVFNRAMPTLGIQRRLCLHQPEQRLLQSDLVLNSLNRSVHPGMMLQACNPLAHLRVHSGRDCNGAC
jgi:hypothetical protein